MQKHKLLEKLCHADKALSLYPKNEKTLVGFSGGADSMTLLHALCTYLGKEKIVAVHINHMLRGEDADEDERFCMEYCNQNNIEYHARRVNISALCGNSGFEEAARNVRYQIFSQIAKETNCATVSLAHTADDNLETVIFHLCRGAGAAGISGIPPKRELDGLSIVRPLIDCTRSEILAYTEENKLSYRTDATNDNTQYTRNFIRKHIVPLMKEVNPNAAENTRNTCTAIAALSAHMEEEIHALLPNGNETKLALSILRKTDDALLYALMNRLYRNACGNALQNVQAQSLAAAVRSGNRGLQYSLPHGITAELRGEHLRFFASTENFSALTEETPLSFGVNRITDRIFVFVGIPCEKQNAAFFRSAKIPQASLQTLILRPRKNGESYRFGGMKRMLKKLLAGADTATKNRPLFCDADGILWHPDFPVRDGNADTETIPIHYIEIK